ncbi:hypothetical protein AVHY2522_19750 [Acidovorax sp. SUPP2522]|uniref:hypothetical protein n=1 Tax=unclassified Acidovorax TaxID=2684926 RepID=UPI0023498168|nr:MULTISPECIES: hypothetical protein [unclassified Acidovorax]WCM99261.1 hypothetical protein M5C96_07560 [Acidovorax sp. GBBC 1281]GKT18684.1 hypothetical protein AVHY2522_19750 [Acidovorax sp. SUPP2522]
MTPTTPIPADAAHPHGRAFAATFEALRETGRQVHSRPHRSMTPLKVTPFLLIQAIVLPAALCALLVWGRRDLFDFWRDVIVFWSQALDIPLRRLLIDGRVGSDGMALTAGASDRPLPGMAGMAAAAGMVVVLLLASLRMRKASLPLKYPMRIIGVVQAFALAYFWFIPQHFPYTISRHSEELMFIGYVMMVATPVMLGAGYYILNESLLSKVGNTLAILAFFALLIPHQVMAQAFLMHHLSVLYMPVLYICFGAVFDALVFVALYSWVMSDVSPNAMR